MAILINLQNVAAIVADRMVGAVDANPHNFIHMDDLESVYESWFDMIVEPKIPKYEYTRVYKEVEKMDEIQMAYKAMKGLIDEARQEAIAEITYQKNPLQALGMSQRDFV